MGGANPSGSRGLATCSGGTRFRRRRPNYEVFDSAGRLIARVDFAWPEFGVFLEFDGKEKYLKYLREGESVVDAVRREKKREEQICRATGWRCIRITWADLYTPEKTCAHIASVLRRRPRLRVGRKSGRGGGPKPSPEG